jgi:ubiquinone/menaquinone biosynthesis C-methylase UbiE
MRRITAYEPFPDDPGRNARQERLEVPIMVRCLALPRGVRMLEIGCGPGVALNGLARLCEPSSLVGLDVDGALVAEARRRLDETRTRCELVVGDVREMPFDDEAFDVVVDFGTLYHIASAEIAVREVARVLRPGGLFAYETKLSQLLSHPVRARGRTIPWAAETALRRGRWAGLWATRTRG